MAAWLFSFQVVQIVLDGLNNILKVGYLLYCIGLVCYLHSFPFYFNREMRCTEEHQERIVTCHLLGIWLILITSFFETHF